MLSILSLSAINNNYASDMQSPTGLWKIVDEDFAKPLALIRIYEAEGKFFGRIEHSFDKDDMQRICQACDDDRNGKPVIGLIILRNLKYDQGEYTDGDILDPDTGAIYNCKIAIKEQGAKLLVRGFLGLSIIGKSQVWIREQ